MIASPPAAESPNNLLQRARQGDQDAWETLFKECYPKIVRVVRHRLSRPMRKLYDSTDIANEVMKSLAAKFDNFDFSSIDGLRAFLIRAAEQKVVDGYRRGHARKRDEIWERRPAARPRRRGRLGAADDSPDRQPGRRSPPEEEESLLEARAASGVTVLELKIQGLSNSEVARETGWHLRKVERFLEKLRGTWRI